MILPKLAGNKSTLEMSDIKKLAGQTATYGVSSIVGRFLNYLLVPIYTRVFVGDAGIAEYGVSTWFYSTAAVGAVIFTYGMETAFFRFAQREEYGSERVFSTTTWSLIGSSVVFSALIFAFAKPLAAFCNMSGYEAYFRIFALIFSADAISTVPFAWLRQQNEATRFAKIRILGIATNIGLNLLFYLVIPFFVANGLFASLNTEGVSVVWMFVANLAASVVVLPFFAKEYRLLKNGFDAALWRTMFSYAYPLIFMGLAGMINETIDRIMLNSLIADPLEAKRQMGIYGANYKLSIIITLFIQAFRFAAEPFFFAQAKGEDSRLTYARVMQYFVAVCVTIFVGVMLYLDIFKFFIGKSYYEGLKVVPILLMANLFLGVYYNLSIWYKLTDRTRLGAYVSLFGAAVTLILNYAWIPTMGYEGSAWATLICYFSMTVVSYVLGQKYFPVPYPMRRIVSLLALGLTVYFASDLLRDLLNLSVFPALCVNTLLIAVYFGLLYKIEEKELSRLLKHKIRLQ